MQSLAMLALVAGLLFATLTFSAPITGNEKIVNAKSAGTLAKRDGKPRIHCANLRLTWLT